MKHLGLPHFEDSNEVTQRKRFILMDEGGITKLLMNYLIHLKKKHFCILKIL